MKRDMRERVERLQKYWNTYDNQPEYLEYTDKIFLDDALYGIAASMSNEYFSAKGFEEFKKLLREHLREGDK
jgi:hypothetical protein